MSASPSATAPSQKRPLEEPSSPSGVGDQPDAKRPALNKVVKEEEIVPPTESEPAIATPTAPDTPVKTDSTATSATVAPAPSSSNGDTAKDGQGDTIVPDAPFTLPMGAAQVLETQPIQSTSSANGRGSSQGPAGHQDETGWLHMRAIISSAEAATVIGKGGENVSVIRRLSGARCTVSDYSRGAVERILTVSGLVDAVAKVSLVAPSTMFHPKAHQIGFRLNYPNTQQ